MNKKLILGIIFGIIVVLLSIYTTFTGIKWGLPNEAHLYSFHPDEGINIGGAIRIFGGEKTPGFFNYSSLYFYIVAYVMTVASTCGILNLGETLTPENLATIYMCGRVTSGILTVLTALLIYLTGYRLSGVKGAFVGGILFAFTPLIVMHSKYIAVDCACGFFVALCIFISTYINMEIPQSPLSRGATRKNQRFFPWGGLPLILSSVAAGLAMGCKYNGLIVFLVPLTLLIIALIEKKINLKNLIISVIISGVITLVTFLITTPGIFLETGKFLDNFFFEVNHVKNGLGDEFTDTGIGIFYNFTKNMFYGMGFLYSFLAIISLVFPFFTKNKYVKSISIFALIYYVSISMGQVRFARYLIPVMPAFAVLVGYMCATFMNKKNIFLKIITVLVLIVALGKCALVSHTINMAYTEVPTHINALNFLDRDKKIGLPTTVWYYTPPFNRETSVMREVRYKFTMENEKYNIVCPRDDENEWNVDLIKQEKPEIVVISSVEEYSKKRLHNPKYEEYMKYIDENYAEFGLIKSSCGYDPTNFPTDMTYLQPVYRIYALRDK